MERKSMGTFIAVLRKANGLTQKELAEKLNVSDKTVSRWERSDGAPDLSLIPVIAEIFGVTSDELLRGERSPAIDQETMDGDGKLGSRAEKQRRWMVVSTMSKYQNLSLVASGIAAIGLIAAMVLNFGFDCAYIGFLIGTIFYLASVICQCIFINNAFLAVADNELASTETEIFKRSVIFTGEKVIGFSVVVLATSIPLIYYPADTANGLPAQSWLGMGMVFGVSALVLCIIATYFLNAFLLKKGAYKLGDKQSSIYWYNFKLKRTCILVLSAMLLISCAFHAMMTRGWDASSIAEGTTFSDLDTFKDFMERDVPFYVNDEGLYSETSPHYDEDGNEIFEDEKIVALTDGEGRVVCEYIHRNHAVVIVKCGASNNGGLPITVINNVGYRAAQDKIRQINSVFIAIYFLEIAAVILVCIRKYQRED